MLIRTTSQSNYVLVAIQVLALSFTYMVMAIDYLKQDSKLGSGESLVSGILHLTMLPNCNLMLTEDNIQVWESGTSGWGSNCILLMQHNGNLEIINNFNLVVWQSMTKSYTKDNTFMLKLERDEHGRGLAVIYLTTISDKITISIWSTINSRSTTWF